MINTDKYKYFSQRRKDAKFFKSYLIISNQRHPRSIPKKICEFVASHFLTFDFYFYLYLCQEDVKNCMLQTPENQSFTNANFLCQELGLQLLDNQAQFLGLSTLDNNPIAYNS